MPSPRWRVAGSLLAVLVLAYSVVIAGDVLLGVLAAGLVYLLCWLVALVSPERVLADMGSTRAGVALVIAVLVLAYAFVIATQILLGVVVATVVVFVAWLTAPNGPVVRTVRWVRSVREDLHAVRAVAEADRQRADAEDGDERPDED